MDLGTLHDMGPNERRRVPPGDCLCKPNSSVLIVHQKTKQHKCMTLSGL